MTAVSKLAIKPSPDRFLRPFDGRKDTRAVADLVEMCFADTLDADGRRYLNHLRMNASNTGLLRWTALTAGLSSASLSGYVWEQDGKIVGNASLIPYFVGGKRFFLIANVAVHQEYRRLGIARKLTERVIQQAQAQGAPQVWLHVRDDNEAAYNLYHSLNFIEQTRRTTWLNHGQRVPDNLSANVRFVPLRGSHWPLLRRWLQETYPPKFAWHLAINANLLRPGFLGWLWRMINNTYVTQWGMLEGRRLLGVASWQSSHGATDQLYLAVPSDSREDDVRALLVYTSCHIPSQRMVSLDYPAEMFSQACQAAGFSKRQTLIWMCLDLN